MPKKQAPQKDLVVEAIMKMSSKIDNLDTRLDSVDKTLVKQEANLGEHMRRTELAERNIEMVQIQSSRAIEDIRTDLKPLQTHKAFIEGALKGIGLLATAVSVIAGIIKIFSYISTL